MTVPEKNCTNSPSLASVPGTPKIPTSTNASRRNYKSKNSTDNRPFVLYLNARSVKSVSKNRNKLHQLKNAVTLGKFDIVAITETWLDSELMHPNYSVYRRDRHDILSAKIGGGVNNNISSFRRHNLEPQEEIVVCEVKPNNQSKILFILAYKMYHNLYVTFPLY